MFMRSCGPLKTSSPNRPTQPDLFEGSSPKTTFLKWSLEPKASDSIYLDPLAKNLNATIQGLRCTTLAQLLFSSTPQPRVLRFKSGTNVNYEAGSVECHPLTLLARRNPPSVLWALGPECRIRMFMWPLGPMLVLQSLTGYYIRLF